MVQGGLARWVAVCLAAAVGLLLAAAGAASAATYFGATISGEAYGQKGNAPNNLEAWDRFERHAGKKVAILNQGHAWAAFDKGEMDATHARGAIPLVTMSLGSGMTLADVVDGSQDAAIKKWAQEAKAFGHPFLFAPWWEMNGAWYAWGRSPDFIAAWRRFHDLVVGQGATNVTWTWVVNSIWSDPESDPTPYYPGDAYVDWTGLDGYNWGTNPTSPRGWKSFDQLFRSSYDQIAEAIAPGKPMMLGEFGSSEHGGSKADWIRDALARIPAEYPQVRAALWFDKFDDNMDWPIETSTSATAAFGEGIRNPVYVGASYGGLAGGAIAPPS